MSAIVTTAPVVPEALENGVRMSPTLAFLVSTMPAKGARISVWSTLTSAARRLARATAICASSVLIAACALLKRASAESTAAPETKSFCASSRERFSATAASASSACPCARLASAALTPAAACSRPAATSRFSSRAITSPSATRWPSSTPSHSSLPVALLDTEARRAATTRPVALSTAIDCDGQALATVAISTASGRPRCEARPAAAPMASSASSHTHGRFHSGLRRRSGAALRSIDSLLRALAELVSVIAAAQKKGRRMLQKRRRPARMAGGGAREWRHRPPAASA